MSHLKMFTVIIIACVMSITSMAEANEEKGVLASDIKDDIVATIEHNNINDWDIIVADDKKRVEKPSIKDDFYNNVNYEWLTETKLPEGYPMIDEFTEAEKATNEYLIDMLRMDDVTQSSNIEISRKIFHAVNDWDNRKNIKAGGLNKEIKKLESTKNLKELNQYIIKNDILGIRPFEIKNTGKNEILITRLNGILKDPIDYFKNDKIANCSKEKLSKYVHYILEEIGYTKQDVDRKIENNYFIEKEIAKIISSKDNKLIKKDDECVYDSIDRFEAELNNLPIKRVILSYGFNNVKNCYVKDMQCLKKINEFYTSEHMDEIKDYLLIHMLLKYYYLQDITPQKYYYEWLKSVNKLLPTISNDNILLDNYIKTTDDLINDNYVWSDMEYKKRKYFNEDEIINACQKILINDIPIAKIKLPNMKINKNINKTSDFWKSLSTDYSNIYDINLAIKKSRIESNNMNEHDTEIKLKDEYEVSPFYYQPSNSINIPKSFMFLAEKYSKNIPEEKLCMDFVVAHEVAHSVGYKSRKDSKIKNPYSKNEQKWINFFNNLKIDNYYKYNGENILEEFEADIQAMRYVLDVAKTIPNFNYKQFFINYAKLWRSLGTKDAVLELIKTDVHPLSIYRVNAVLQQFDEFYEAFDIKKGDKMYLDPKYRYLNTITP